MANAMQSRRENQMAVLRAIQQNPGISKPALGRRCGLTASTVHNIVTRLQEVGIVAPMGEAGSTGGRKPQRYAVRGDYRYSLAVSMGQGQVELGILGIGLTVLQYRQRTLSMAETGPESYIAAVTADLAEMLEESGIEPAKIAGIGVSVPGPTDFGTGTVQEIPGVPGWSGYPLAARLGSVMELPVWVDKRAYTGLAYLRYTGEAKPEKNTVLLSVGEGICAGLLVEGNILRGAGSLAGEIGHLPVQPDGPLCACGGRGCLSLYCGDAALVAGYGALAAQTVPDGPQGRVDSIKELVTLTQDGNEIASAVLGTAAGYLAQAVVSAILSYGPDEVIIHCSWLEAVQEEFYRQLEAKLDTCVLTQAGTTEVRLLDRVSLQLRAAAAMVYEQVLFAPGTTLIADME